MILLLLFIWFCSPSSAFAASWVQNQIDAVNSSGGSSTTLTTTTFNFLHTFTSRNGLAGMVLKADNQSGGPTGVSGITDNLSNIYTVLDTVTSGFAFATTFATTAVNGVPSTLTVNFTGAVNATTWHVWAWADEVSSVLSIDKHAALWNTSAVSVLTSGSAITTAPDLVLGFGSPNSNILTAGTGFTIRLNDTTQGLYSESLVQSSSGSQAATFNVSPNDTGPVGMIAFSPSCLVGGLATMGVGC